MCLCFEVAKINWSSVKPILDICTTSTLIAWSLWGKRASNIKKYTGYDPRKKSVTLSKGSIIFN